MGQSRLFPYVQENLLQREREYLFFLGFVEALMRSPVTEDSLQQLCDLSLVFVNEVLELDCVISQISAERFGGQPILFSDSALRPAGRGALRPLSFGVLW